MKLFPKIGPGWQQSPTWARLLIGFVILSQIVGLASLFLMPGLSIILKSAFAVLSIIICIALIGTITDVFSAPPEDRPQKLRSLAIGASLVLLMGIFFAATIIRMGGNVANRTF